MRSMFSSLMKVGILVLFMSMVFSGPLQAEIEDKSSGCTLNCNASPSVSGGMPPMDVTFLSTVETSGCSGSLSYQWKVETWSLESSAYVTVASSTLPIFSHTFSSEGSGYTWELKVSMGDQTCTKQGSLSFYNPEAIAIIASANPVMGPAPLKVQFKADRGFEPTPACGGNSKYRWYVAEDDGSMSECTEQTFTRTYSTPGLKWWYVSNSFSFLGCMTNTISGAILIENNCLPIGTLSLCADERTKDPNSETYTLKGNVNLNGQLWFTDDVVFTASSQGSSTGSLTTSGSIYVKLKNVNETLLKGPLSFDVDGNTGSVTPKLNDVQWAASLAGMPLWVSGTPITLSSDGVKIEPTLFIGNAGMTLASFKASIVYVPGNDKKLLGFELIQGQLTPGIQFFGMSGTYDPDTDIFTGSVSVGFPFMGTWSVSATIRIKPSCSEDGTGLNGFDISIGLPDPIPLGTTGLGVAGFTLKVDNICDIPKFFIFIGGDLGIAEVPGEIFTLSQIGVGYQRPYLMNLEGGTANLLGFPIGNLSGRISFKPKFAGITFKGFINFASIYQANVNGFLSVSKKTIAGSSSGSLQIPDFSCSWYNVPCRTLKTAITSVTSLPITLNAQEMDMLISSSSNGWQGMFRGMQKIGPISLAVVLQYANDEFDILVGPNYADVFGVGSKTLRSNSTERSVTLAVPQPQAIFSVAANSESSALPSIYLKNPMDDTITPSNVKSYAGVHYTEDNALKVALFRIDEAAIGTWTLGVNNLADSEVTFQCLVPTTAPTTTFNSVTPGVDKIDIQATVTPASSETKVSFFISEEASGGMGEPIAENLSSSSGMVSSTWDTTGLSGGTYYLFARTDNGNNPPVITYYANPLQIGSKSIQPPTDLSGSFSGTKCQLQWTSVPTDSGVAGYRVLYTDNPALPGYAFSITASTENSSLVEGLQSDMEYRFAVVAYDENGNESAPSVPWYSGTVQPQDVRQLQSSIPVSDSVDQNAWKFFRISVPADPLLLEVYTNNTSDNIDLYLKKGSKPNISDYDYLSNGSSTSEKITVTPTSTPMPLSQDEWYIGVYGNQQTTFSVGATILICTEGDCHSVPGAPTLVEATAGDTQATVTFTSPSSNGGSEITGYTVTSNPGGKTATGTYSPITVTGLTNGTAYTFTVTASNAFGTGTPSAASDSVTPENTETPVDENIVQFPEKPVGTYPTTLTEISSAPVNVGTMINGETGIVLSGDMQIDIYFPKYNNLVDIYVGIGEPPDPIDSENIYLLDETQELVPLSTDGFVKYGERVYGPVVATIINYFTVISTYFHGEWLVAWIVLPTGTDVNQVDWLNDPAIFGWYFFNIE
ncbi:MAG: fibronectin type III domain-containing protein [Desulfobacterales bacterium]|nr:fibronectin type III domain-containing protein [Desulfobacterales bacterium]